MSGRMLELWLEAMAKNAPEKVAWPTSLMMSRWCHARSLVTSDNNRLDMAYY